MVVSRDGANLSLMGLKALSEIKFYLFRSHFSGMATEIEVFNHPNRELVSARNQINVFFSPVVLMRPGILSCSAVQRSQQTPIKFHFHCAGLSAVSFVYFEFESVD